MENLFYGLEEDFSILILTPVVILFIIYTYKILKNLGKRKLGIWLSTILSLIVILNIFEDSFFFRYNARNILRKHNFELLDEFEIIRNKSKKLFQNYHSFKLQISNSDKERLINQIKSAENFGKIDELWETTYHNDTIFTHNYSTEWHYHYNYKSFDGTKCNWIQIYISKTENTLEYIK